MPSSTRRVRFRRPQARFAPLAGATLALAGCEGPLPPPPRPSPDVALIDALVDRPLARVALGSCSNPAKPQPVWDAVLRDAPDLYLALGDNIYGDTEDINQLRAKYWAQEAVPGFAALRRTVPVYGTWDDHDFGANDAGAEYPKKAESLQLLLDFLRVPADSPRRGRPGAYDAVIVGPPGRRVHFVALDVRYHRSALTSSPAGNGYYVPDLSPEATMLGAEQWAWLEREFARPAEVRIILSSTPLVALNTEGEMWDNMPRERERFLAALGRASPAARLVVSGDRHFGDTSVLDPAPDGAPLYELTSSGLTEAGGPPLPNPLRTGTPINTTNYGLVDFEWDAPEPAFVLRLRDVNGRDASALRVPMSPPPPPPALAAP